MKWISELIHRFKLWFVAAGTAGVVAVGMNPEVLETIKHFEGFEEEAYLDPVGIPTIGYGHTNAAGTVTFNMGDAWTEEYATEVLLGDVQMFWDGLDDMIHVDLTACQHSVLTSWAYNVGLGAAERSTLVRILNQGDYAGVPAQLMRWDKAGGQTLRGLTRRRAAEADLWVTNCGEDE